MQDCHLRPIWYDVWNTPVFQNTLNWNCGSCISSNQSQTLVGFISTSYGILACRAGISSYSLSTFMTQQVALKSRVSLAQLACTLAHSFAAALSLSLQFLFGQRRVCGCLNWHLASFVASKTCRAAASVAVAVVALSCRWQPLLLPSFVPSLSASSWLQATLGVF